MNRKLLILLISFLALAQLGLIFLLLRAEPIKLLRKEIYTLPVNIDEQKKELSTHSSYFSSKDFYDEAYREIPREYKNAFYDKKVYGGIIPHHLIVKNNIASFFAQLEKQDYETVVLIGPNHFDGGEKNVLISQSKWLTPYGDIEPNLEIINKLIKTGKVHVNEEPFYREHSISGLVPFIKKSIPNAQIVPIILKIGLRESDAEKISELIFENIDPEKTLVISSVDFSHYLPAQVADFHDERSNGIIQDFDFERIYSMEIDSPPSIYVLLRYLELVKAQESKLLWHTNSGYMDESQPSTTHNIYYFTKGNPRDDSVISMMFFGDMMLDRYIGDVIDRNGVDYIFENIQHEENRFFRGMDIISANLEGAVTNNGDHYSPSMINDFAFSSNEVKQFKKYNFNFFNLANNHFSDQGIVGIEETRDNLDLLGIDYSGCRDKKVNFDCSIKELEIADKKIAMLGLSMVYGKFDIESAKDIIKDASVSNDFVVINIHWGQEYKHQFNKTQQSIAYQLIDAGASVIVGHHPHIVQGVEIYKNKPIFYSLGNFIFDQPAPFFSKDNSESFALGLTIQDKKVIYDIFPFRMKKWQLELMGNEDKDIFLEEILEWSSLDEKKEKDVLNGGFEILR